MADSPAQRSGRPLPCAAILAAALAAAPTLHARTIGRQEYWAPDNVTASVVTGPVTFATSRMTFSHGASLAIARRGRQQFTDDFGGVDQATLYAVIPPADPELHGGNRLCGSPEAPVPVTWLLVWPTRSLLAGQPPGRAFAAFSDAAPPQPDATPGCGIYRYRLGKHP